MLLVHGAHLEPMTLIMASEMHSHQGLFSLISQYPCPILHYLAFFFFPRGLPNNLAALTPKITTQPQWPHLLSLPWTSQPKPPPHLPTPPPPGLDENSAQ